MARRARAAAADGGELQSRPRSWTTEPALVRHSKSKERCPMIWRALAALHGAIGFGVLLASACDSPVIETPCPAVSPGTYTYHLTYLGEYTYDGGCAGARLLDGQSITVSLGQGSAEVTTAAGMLSCIATSDAYDIAVRCPMPTGNELEISLDGPCQSPDAAVEAQVQLVILVDGDASPGTLADPLCTSLYEAM
jgi:hypothetical protein